MGSVNDGKDAVLFSVICPTYNGAERLPESLSSVTGQTFTNYELIVVCDSCEDNSAEVARQYTDKVIEVDFHRDGLTRNAGLDAAQGEWILFIDDDDFFMHEYVFSLLAEKIAEVGENVDVIDYSFIWGGKGYNVQSEDNINIMVWSRAWKRSFIGERRFNDFQYGSDSYFFSELILHNPDCRVCFYDKLMYYYNYMREGSMSHNLKKNGMTKDPVSLDLIITHYNEPWEVGKKLFDSIALQECCNYNDINIILVQDGQEGALDWRELLKDYPFKVKIVTVKEHSGVATARNAGMKHTEAEWMMFMDFDDMFADVCSMSQIMSLFPITTDVDIIWSKYVREVSGHGRHRATSLNCEDHPDYRMIGKLFRKEFLGENHIRFIKEHEEYCDQIFNTIALASTYDFRFMSFSAPFYPYIKRLRADGAFSTIETLEKRAANMVERNIILAREMQKRGIKRKYGVWIARTVIDAYHSIVSADAQPDDMHGITQRLIDFWRENRDTYMSVSPNDIEVAIDESESEVMTYIQYYYNDFGKEYYLQNDMMPLEKFISILDDYAFNRKDVPQQAVTAPENVEDDVQEAEQEPIPVNAEEKMPPVAAGRRAVVYCGTKETYINMIASVKSLLATTPVDDVYFLTEDDEFPYELPAIVHNINVKPYANEIFDQNGPNFHNVWTYMCLIRTAFPMMFKQYDKVLSLDIDVVITEDVSDLWDIDLTDYYFAGVEEQGHKNISENEFYANFGVIMMNLKKMREDRIGEKLVDAVNEEHFTCPEQDAFNKYCKGHIYKLPNDYNVTVYSHITGEALRERILHYAGLTYWKHFGPVKKYYNLPWSKIMELQESARNG